MKGAKRLTFPFAPLLYVLWNKSLDLKLAESRTNKTSNQTKENNSNINSHPLENHRKDEIAGRKQSFNYLSTVTLHASSASYTVPPLLESSSDATIIRPGDCIELIYPSWLQGHLHLRSYLKCIKHETF